MPTRPEKKALRPSGKLRQVIDPLIAKALAHPLRSHVLATLRDRVASPNEMAKELGIDARDLNYHVRVLVNMEMICLVRVERRRGVWEHFYELRQPLDEGLEALMAATFAARDNHQSRTKMMLDEQGWSQLTRVMDETLEKVLEIRDACARNLQRSGGEGIPIEFFMVGFETAAGVSEEPAAGAVPAPAAGRPGRAREQRPDRASAR